MISFSKQYDLNYIDYLSLEIETAGLTEQLTKKLEEEDVCTVGKLLLYNSKELEVFFDLTPEEIIEIESYVGNLANVSNCVDKNETIEETNPALKQNELSCGNVQEDEGISNQSVQVDGEIEGIDNIYSIPIEEIIKLDDIAEVQLEDIGFSDDLLKKLKLGGLKTVRKMGLFSINELFDFCGVVTSEFNDISDAIDRYRIRKRNQCEDISLVSASEGKSVNDADSNDFEDDNKLNNKKENKHGLSVKDNEEPDDIRDGISKNIFHPLLSDMYEVDSSDYKNYSIYNAPISNRLKNVLNSNNINSVEELLNKTLFELRLLNGFASTSEREICNFLSQIRDVKCKEVKEDISKTIAIGDKKPEELSDLILDEKSDLGEGNRVREESLVESCTIIDSTQNDNSILEKEQVQKEVHPDYKSDHVSEVIEETLSLEEQSDDLLGFNKPFYLVHGLNPEDYSAKSILDVNLPRRVKNILLRNKIGAVSDLLKLSPYYLMSLNNFGKSTLDDVIEFVSNLSSIDVADFIAEKNDGAHVEESRDKMCDTFGALYNLVPAQYHFNYINEYTFSNRLGNRLLKLNIRTIEDLLNKSMADMLKVGGFGRSCQTELVEFIFSLSGEKKEEPELKYGNLPAEHFIKAFTDDDNARNTVFSYLSDREMALNAFIDEIGEKKNEEIALNKFVKWCAFDLENDISNIKKIVKDNPKWDRIISLRAQKKTLELVGNDIGVTRERVRQIEKKAIIAFGRFAKTTRLLWKIYAVRSGDSVLTPTELSEYFGEDTDEFIYLLKNCETYKKYYDHNTDTFVMSDYSLAESVQEYLDSIPETLAVKDKEKYIIAGVQEYELPEELLERSFDECYDRTGEVYHRFRLVLKNIYLDVLEKHYPNGMHIYDAKELASFREKVEFDYGISMADKSDRSIIGILSSNGILCGRGRYKLNKGNFISKELAQKIYQYVESANQPIILIGAIFDVFEEELVGEGIDNRYFLQGILHELYDDCWYFKRDYIAKDPSFTSVYTSVVTFIKHSKYPVTKEEIFKAFPGLTDIVLQLSVSDSNVLNLFGSYIHGNNISITDGEKQYLHSVLEEALSDKDLIHVKDIHPIVVAENAAILSKNFISFPFGLFSLLEYLFGGEYVFSRPFISKDEIQFDRARDVIDGTIADSDIMSISEIQSLAKEYHFTIYSLLDFIDSCNDMSLLINSSEIMKIEKIGVDINVVNYIEKLICEEITGTVPIANLACIMKFPTINVPWTDWLIYSLIKKWGTSLDVAASSEQFRYSFPVVAPKGMLNLEGVKNLDKENVGHVATIDDLDNIDELIGDYILDEDDLV
ncbi:Sigma-70, region 4 [Butyrivibrio sp. Su6]|uniref:DNA-directed RNA polymerase subunit alpha C-terminal domain-containing protein n=1 Tax=Butyrivibrio sp. Su6 TaxID=1520810 RepID=UPI00089EC004|nr:DNA-directed RNA polymerase subunit alpha C-terminal domain-containing protein [Butyrivibrio sp. Su6]SEF62092.1 Sigma-70, region 4 [Butyrivibrio sp. Su6]